MDGRKTIVTVLRSLALASAVVIFVLGMWSLVIVQAIDSSRGRRTFAVLQPMIHSKLGDDDLSWSQFIAAAQQGVARIWVIVVTSLLTTFTTLVVTMSNRYYWLRISPPAVLSLEAVPTTATIIAFACALSLSLDLSAFDSSPLSIFTSKDLSFFAQLNPLSRGLTITSFITVVLLLITFTAHLIIYLQRRRREKDTRSFEPTVSALGMSHGFHALHPPPRTSRPPIPTIYDPYRAFKKGPGALQVVVPQPEAALRPSAIRRETQQGEMVSKHVGFADEGVWIGRKSDSRWSVSTVSPRRVEGDIMRLLELRKAREVRKLRRAVPVRPARDTSDVHTRQSHF